MVRLGVDSLLSVGRRQAPRQPGAEAHAPHEGREDEHGGPGGETKAEKRIERVYSAVMRPLIAKGRYRTMALAAVVVLLFASVGLLFVRAVAVKMLPYDNKSELQIVIDMPEGSTLEKTVAVAQRLARTVAELPEVTDVQVYAGTAAPIGVWTTS